MSEVKKSSPIGSSSSTGGTASVSDEKKNYISCSNLVWNVEQHPSEARVITSIKMAPVGAGVVITDRPLDCTLDCVERKYFPNGFLVLALPWCRNWKNETEGYETLFLTPSKDGDITIQSLLSEAYHYYMGKVDFNIINEHLQKFCKPRNFHLDCACIKTFNASKEINAKEAIATASTVKDVFWKDMLAAMRNIYQLDFRNGICYLDFAVYSKTEMLKNKYK